MHLKCNVFIIDSNPSPYRLYRRNAFIEFSLPIKKAFWGTHTHSSMKQYLYTINIQDVKWRNFVLFGKSPCLFRRRREEGRGFKMNCETPLPQPSPGSVTQQILYVYCGDYVFLEKSLQNHANTIKYSKNTHDTSHKDHPDGIRPGFDIGPLGYQNKYHKQEQKTARCERQDQRTIIFSEKFSLFKHQNRIENRLRPKVTIKRSS